MSRKKQEPMENLFGEMEERVSEDASPIAEWIHRERRPLVEETSKRSTFLLDKELIERLDRAASGQKRGFKTWLVNKAIKEMLDRLEEEGR